MLIYIDYSFLEENPVIPLSAKNCHHQVLIVILVSEGDTQYHSGAIIGYSY